MLPPNHRFARYQPASPAMYWMHDTSGMLQPVIERYLAGEPLTTRQVALFRGYLTQWVMSPVWDQNPHDSDAGAALGRLRARVEVLGSAGEIQAWLHDALREGIDPL
jgi:hypothetical protein